MSGQDDWTIVETGIKIFDNVDDELSKFLKNVHNRDNNKNLELITSKVNEKWIKKVYKFSYNEKTYIYKFTRYIDEYAQKYFAMWRRALRLYKELSEDTTLSEICKLLLFNINYGSSEIKMIIEYGGDKSLIDYERDDTRDISSAIKIASDILKVVIYLRVKGIVHGDIKADNIVLTITHDVNDHKSVNAKLIDFENIYGYEDIGSPGIVRSRVCISSRLEILNYCKLIFNNHIMSHGYARHEGHEVYNFYKNILSKNDIFAWGMLCCRLLYNLFLQYTDEKKSEDIIKKIIKDVIDIFSCNTFKIYIPQIFFLFIYYNIINIKNVEGLIDDETTGAPYNIYDSSKTFVNGEYLNKLLGGLLFLYECCGGVFDIYINYKLDPHNWYLIFYDIVIKQNITDFTDMARMINEKAGLYIQEENKKALPVIIHGASGEFSNIINGLFKPSVDIVGPDGRKIYIKHTDINTRIEYSESEDVWYIRKKQDDDTWQDYAYISDCRCLTDRGTYNWYILDKERDSMIKADNVHTTIYNTIGEAGQAWIEAEEAEQARIAAEAEEAEKSKAAAEAEKAEQARIAAEAEKAEQARIAAEAEEAEQARIAKAEKIIKEQNQKDQEEINRRIISNQYYSKRGEDYKFYHSGWGLGNRNDSSYGGYNIRKTKVKKYIYKKNKNKTKTRTRTKTKTKSNTKTKLKNKSKKFVDTKIKNNKNKTIKYSKKSYKRYKK
jgi:serine/threonine protein kinase